MRTTFKDILDRAYTTLFTDYKLDELAKIDEQAFYDFLGGMLVNACDIFDGCLSDLSYHIEQTTEIKNDEIVTVNNYVFDNDLTSKEQYLLALGVALFWYRKQLDDVTQFRDRKSTRLNSSHL